MIAVVCGVIGNAESEILLCQRPEGKSQAGLWEFPGGKVEDAESPQEALARELREELGCVAIVGEALTAVVHDYGSFSIQLQPFLCRLEGEPQALEHQALEWVPFAEMEGYALAPADVPIVQEWGSLQAEVQ